MQETCLGIWGHYRHTRGATAVFPVTQMVGLKWAGGDFVLLTWWSIYVLSTSRGLLQKLLWHHILLKQISQISFEYLPSSFSLSIIIYQQSPFLLHILFHLFQEFLAAQRTPTQLWLLVSVNESLSDFISGDSVCRVGTIFTAARAGLREMTLIPLLWTTWRIFGHGPRN